jgi:hypothetical protein
MSLETKGTIKYDPDVKPSDPEYIISVKQLGITAEGSGNVEQMMDELSERVRREMSEQFGIPRCDVEMVKYSITCTFDVSAPVNTTLDQFEGEKVLEKAADIVNSGALDGSGFTVTATTHKAGKRGKGAGE